MNGWTRGLLFALAGLCGCDVTDVKEAQSINCSVYWRLSPYAGGGGSTEFTETLLDVPAEDKWTEAVVEDFIVQIKYVQTDSFGTGFVKIYVWPEGVEQDVSSALQEVLHDAPSQNIANFTGLNYVYHPVSGNELQYTCDAE